MATTSRHHILVKAGDLFYIPAGVPHLPANPQRQAVGHHCAHRSQRAGGVVLLPHLDARVPA